MRIRQLVAASFAAVVVILTAVSCGESGPEKPSDPMLALGQDVFNRKCATCHGRSGNGGSAPKLKDVIAARYTVEEHTAIVMNGAGGGRMPAFGGELSREEIDAVVRYEREGL